MCSLRLWFSFSFDLIKSYIAPVCFMHYWPVDIIGLFPEALITLIRTSLGLFSASFLLLNDITWRCSPSKNTTTHCIHSREKSIAAPFSRAIKKFFNFAHFSEGLHWPPPPQPIMYSGLYVKEQGRDLICWQLPPICLNRLLIDNGEGERWTLNRHSNYRL